MFPSLARNNIEDGSFANTKGGRDLPHGYALLALLAYLTNLCLRKLRSAASLPTCLSAFVYRVLSVFIVASEKQMVRAHAWRVIALVANVQTFGDVAIGYFIGNAVNALQSAFVIHHCPVPFKIRRANPKPARVGFVDVSPQADSSRLGFALAVARLAAIDTAALFDFRRGNMEVNPAVSADGCYSDSSHDLSLLNRLKLWLDPFGSSHLSLGSFCILT